MTYSNICMQFGKIKCKKTFDDLSWPSQINQKTFHNQMHIYCYYIEVNAKVNLKKFIFFCVLCFCDLHRNF